LNHLAIVRILSGIAIVLGAVALLCAGFGVIVSEINEAAVFLTLGVSVSSFGAVILLLTDKPKRKTRPSDALAVTVLFWALATLVCAVPFITYTGDLGAIAALYESASNLTTTGHSLVDSQVDPLSSSLLLWRALLHVIGAIASVTVAVSVFVALNLGGPGIHRNRFFTESEVSFFDSIPQVIRLATVSVMTAIILLGGALIVSGVLPRDALAGAVSAITTGMVDPSAFETFPQQGYFHAFLLWLGLIFGTFGLLVVESLDSERIKALPKDPELIAWVGSIALVAVLAIFAGLPAIQSVGWATSSIATSGIALTDPAQFNRLPVVLVLFPVLIGGSALSAAGGVKLARLIVLSRRVALEFVQLGYRGSVQQFSFRGRRQSERTVMGVWVYLVGYIVACSMGAILFSILGLSFDDSIRAAIGTVSNAGHIIGGMSADLGPIAQICAIMGMILGRLEVVALLPALNPDFWRR
jgi:Trk-type K+ transport system membrane component